MFDHGSDHIALEPIASPKIWIGDAGADATPSKTAMTRSSVPKIFHASTALRLPQRFRAVAAASGIAVKPTITSPHPALCGNGHAQLPAEPRHQRMHEVLQGRVAVQFVLLDPARRSVPSGQTFWTACFHVTVPLRPQSLTGMSLKTFFKQISSGWMKSLIFDAWHPTRSGSRLPTTVAPWLAAMARTRSSIETRLFP